MPRLLSLLIVLLLPLGSARAQSSGDYSRDLDLPSWASPSAPAASDASTGCGACAPPAPPAAPEQVPVDGGLIWLAAAGAGYAARRLYRRGSDPQDAP